MQQKKKKSVKKYRVIAKVKKGSTWTFIKHNVDNLLTYTRYLDVAFGSKGWAYFNVYEYVKGEKGAQRAAFTRNNRPVREYV